MKFTSMKAWLLAVAALVMATAATAEVTLSGVRFEDTLSLIHI